MSSGYGIKGRVGRCYPFIAEYRHCRVSLEIRNKRKVHIMTHSTLKQATEDDEDLMTCLPFKIDYFECLHHRKEYSRVKAIMDQDKINMEAAKKAGNAEGSHKH
jgi:NADH dehydrogenase (ubiquinone) Fe-S protein 5